MADTDEYAKAVADIRRINQVVSPILVSLMAAEKVMATALRAKADAQTWSKEAASIDKTCNELAEKESVFRKRVADAEAKAAEAERDSEMRIAKADHEARDRMSEIAKLVEQSKIKAEAEQSRLNGDLERMVKEMTMKRSEMEVAHTKRLAEMAAEIEVAKAKLDELNAAINKLKKMF